jgi:hypothetical protein
MFMLNEYGTMALFTETQNFRMCGNTPVGDLRTQMFATWRMHWAQLSASKSNKSFDIDGLDILSFSRT